MSMCVIVSNTRTYPHATARTQLQSVKILSCYRIHCFPINYDYKLTSARTLILIKKPIKEQMILCRIYLPWLN